MIEPEVKHQPDSQGVTTTRVTDRVGYDRPGVRCPCGGTVWNVWERVGMQARVDFETSAVLESRLDPSDDWEDVYISCDSCGLPTEELLDDEAHWREQLNRLGDGDEAIEENDIKEAIYNAFNRCGGFG